MFRNRRNSQKPAEEFYAAFRNAHPNVGPGKITPSTAATTESTAHLSGPFSDPIMDHRQFDSVDDGKAGEKTFRGASNDDWRLTSSFIDASSFAYASLTNPTSGYCPSSAGGNGTFYHNKAGDLHTPNLGFHLGTPLNLPQSEGRNLPPAVFDMHGFQPSFLETHGFAAATDFGDAQTFAPSSFLHQDSGFDTMDDTTPKQQTVAGSAMTRQSKISTLPPAMFHSSVQPPAFQAKDKFRYQVTLNAPTAMIKHADEIPVTYLNKGQAYTISIADTLSMAPSPTPVRYRTVVRISFEDQQQRQRPAACWQLWKEGRGLAEAHQRGGKLQAVEYVDPNQGGGLESKCPRVELERSSFDCFSVTWSPAQNATAVECSVAVRFNFLSTDFSHSKGVKGIPVRLCAKTEILCPGTPDSPPGPTSEVCFCKVKLFRDHGAERKLSNDVAHIKKNIEKHKQQVNQVESGTKDLGKRKRSGSMTKANGSRPAKVHKHKRTWSISSQGSGGRPALEEDLQMKLATLQNMFGSTRPYSLLYLKGYEDDDPDVYPVALPGQPPDTPAGQRFDGRRHSQDHKASEVTSPSNSSASPMSAHSAPAPIRSTGQSEFPNIGIGSHMQDDWDAFSQFTNTELPHVDLALTRGSGDPPVKIERSQPGAGMPQWIETVGIDPNYKAPAERTTRPVACVYALLGTADGAGSDECYSAVYLMEHTVVELVSKLAQKCDVDPSRISRTVQVNHKGLRIMVDDAVVREMPEGQDMVVEVSETSTDVAVKEEPSSSPGAATLELRLVF
ncbi:MAG: hypothetical protein Q9169_003571 [Polycauliona sp. 2 TL-2023]